MSDDKQSREGLILRVLWMVLFAIVWQVGELVLLGVVLVQLVLRLVNGRPQAGLMAFGDSLSQYLAQIGRFGCFNSDEKPWPFADWPTPREPEGEGAMPLTPAASAPAAAAASASAVVPAAASTAEAAVEPTPSEVDATATASEAAAPAEAEAQTRKEAGPDTPAEPRA